MNRLLPLIILIFISQYCSAQDSINTIDVSWTKLKFEFQRRNETVSAITNTLAKSKRFTQKELKDIQLISESLVQYTDTLRTLNQYSISKAYLLSSRLFQALEKSLADFEKDSKFKSSVEARDLFFKISALENRMSVLSRDFNTACLTANRKDLFFGKKIDPADLKSESDTSKRTTSALRNKG